MLIKFSTLILFLVVSNVIWGQDNTESEKEGPFLNGIFLENLNLAIPWGTTVEDVSKYGNPEIREDPTSKKLLIISWKSVKILDNISASLTYSSKRSNGSYAKMTDMYMFIDTADVQKAYLFIKKNSGTPTEKMYKGKWPKYQWTFKKYYIQLTKGPHAGVFLVQSDTRGM